MKEFDEVNKWMKIYINENTSPEVLKTYIDIGFSYLYTNKITDMEMRNDMLNRMSKVIFMLETHKNQNRRSSS